MINQAAPDIACVGFGTPEQVRWTYRHRDPLKAAVLFGVGAAFDIHSGTRNQAPR
jgi:N-acetylglucosaminyldiphosphoundecaprenol N-acetyl-beta-D-mannosaminyltransferase